MNHTYEEEPDFNNTHVHINDMPNCRLSRGNLTADGGLGRAITDCIDDDPDRAIDALINADSDVNDTELMRSFEELEVLIAEFFLEECLMKRKKRDVPVDSARICSMVEPFTRCAFNSIIMERDNLRNGVFVPHDKKRRRKRVSSMTLNEIIFLTDLFIIVLLLKTLMPADIETTLFQDVHCPVSTTFKYFTNYSRWTL